MDAQIPRTASPAPLTPRRVCTQGTPRIEPAQVQAKATTAMTPIEVQTLSFPDGSRGTFSAPSEYAMPARGSDLDDAMSVMSLAATMRPPGDLTSLVAADIHNKSRAWVLLSSQAVAVQPLESFRVGTPNGLADFARDLDAIPEGDAAGATDEHRLLLWKSKLKHYMILSSAGKPIWSRHGNLSLINSYMGVVQTIISFYESARNPLLGFTAGKARFVIATEGPLYLVAISRLGESDAQLRDQLDALYMQILSTITLPALTNLFANRPSTDLRKSLQGTEPLLSSLADSFTKGSPSSMLGALECLKIRKSQRLAIHNAFLKTRTDKLLYGLIVAGGRLVSVVRPRKHSLHPSDLQLIFNMLFESGTIKAGGGENWVPLCLPAFNNRGYLYMYVSFFKPAEHQEAATTESEIAVILISPDKESFFDLKDMRDKLASQLAQNGSLAVVQAAARSGRPRVADVAPGAPLSHFILKSRANVQFCMSSLSDPPFGGSEPAALVARRRLMTLYHQLHAGLHARHNHVKVLHCVGEEATALAWMTPVFEMYCVAGPNVSRVVLTQAANWILEWARREEERLFIIGGGVF